MEKTKSKKLTNFTYLMDNISRWLNKDIKCSSTEIAQAIMFTYQYFNPIGIPWYSPKSIKDFDNKKDVEKYYEKDHGKTFELDILSDVVFKYKNNSNLNKVIYFYIHVNDKTQITAPDIKDYTYEYALNPAPFILYYDHRLNAVLDIEASVGKKNKFKNQAELLSATFKKAEEVSQNIKEYEKPNIIKDDKQGSIFYNYAVNLKDNTTKSIFYFTIISEVQSDEKIQLSDISLQSDFIVDNVSLDIDTTKPAQIYMVNRIDSTEYDNILKSEKSANKNSTVIQTDNQTTTITADNTSLVGNTKRLFDKLSEKANNFVNTAASFAKDAVKETDFLEKIKDKEDNKPTPIKRIPLRIQNKQEDGRTYNGINKTILSLPEDREEQQ